MNVTEDALRGWLPYKLMQSEDKILCRWLFVDKETFTEPFFEETIVKCKNLPFNRSRHTCVSNLEAMTLWANELETVQPSAFLFHVSRCGSTLVTQALSMSRKNIALSEVPLFDELLRLPCKYTERKDKVEMKTLAAAISFYGAKRTGDEQTLFIKTDSWHLLFYKQLKELYADTPFIILYRHPAEVLLSQQRQRGMHAVPGLIEPSLFGFTEDELERFGFEHYMALVLEKYYEEILRIAAGDQSVLLLNYNEGINTIMQKITDRMGITLEEKEVSGIVERSRYHAKKPNETFMEEVTPYRLDAPNKDRLSDLYQQIETRRLFS